MSDPIVKVRLHEELIVRKKGHGSAIRSSEDHSEGCAFEVLHCYTCLTDSGHVLEDTCIPVFVSCDLASEVP